MIPFLGVHVPAIPVSSFPSTAAPATTAFDNQTSRKLSARTSGKVLPVSEVIE